MKHQITRKTCHALYSNARAGDAIKSVKPYFGLGVNTAFEDCINLDRCGIYVWPYSAMDHDLSKMRVCQFPAISLSVGVAVRRYSLVC